MPIHPHRRSAHSAVSRFVVGVAAAMLALAGLPAANAQVTACPAAEGWTRLVVPPARRSNGDSVPPWEHEPPIDNGGPRRWLWAISGGWEAPGVVYVGGANRLYRSWDCGSRWELIWNAMAVGAPRSRSYADFIQLLAAAPGGRLYAGFSRGLVASDDFGSSWRSRWGTPEPVALAASPADPDTAYVFRWNGGWARGIHNTTPDIRQTTDGGRSWEDRAQFMPRGTALVDPLNASMVYVVGERMVFRSTDGAKTFEVYASGGPDTGSLDHTAASVDASRFWLFARSGTFVSADRGRTWQRMLDRPFSEQIIGVATSPHDPRVLYVLLGGDEIWAYREPAEPLTDDPTRTAR